MKNVDFIGKAITVRSEQGPEVTVIDGGQMWSVVTIWSGEGRSTMLDGFTITNGTGVPDGWDFLGGGIFCDDSSPLITNNVVMNNWSANGGAGISLGMHYGSDAILINNLIVGNQTDNCYGTCAGGVDGWNGNQILTNNTITDNWASTGFNNGWGGGIRCVGASMTITNCIIWGNHATYGPEISSFGGPVTATYSDVPLSGVGNFYMNPLFVPGPKGNYYLDQALNQCVNSGDEDSPVIRGTTNPTGVQDDWPVDIGYHYPQ